MTHTIISNYYDLSEVSEKITDLKSKKLPVVVFLEGNLVSLEETREKVAFIQRDTRKQVLGITGPHVTKKGAHFWSKVQFPIDGPLVEDLEQLRNAITHIGTVGDLLHAEKIPFCTVGYSQGAIVALFNQLKKPAVFQKTLAVNPGLVKDFPFAAISQEKCRTRLLFSEHDEITLPHTRQELSAALGVPVSTLANEKHAWSVKMAEGVGNFINYNL